MYDDFTAKLVTENAALTAQLNEARETTIEEICTKYYQPIIDNYKKVQRSGEVGRYAHQKDIELYERLIKGLRSQEWIEAALNQQAEKI